MKINLDKWQEEVLNTKGNIVLRSGRQVGKSTVIALKAANYAIQNPKSSILIISSTERQAYLLFSKVLGFLIDDHKKEVRSGKDRPTKSEIKLKNGSIIRSLPTGLDGTGIRGYTVDLLIADEAAFINPDVWQAVRPMLVTTQGNLILLSTPFGQEGYFYDRFQDPSFTKFHISTEEVARSRPEPMRSTMLQYLENEKKTMSSLQYAQEYLGEFVSDLRRWFSDDLIKKCCVLRRATPNPAKKLYLGIDIARLGLDSSAYAFVQKEGKDRFIMVDLIMTQKTLTTETENNIIALARKYPQIKQILIDSGSGTLGVSVFDHLLQVKETKNKIIAINNRARSLDPDDKKRAKIVKEDLYDNLRAMMERGEIILLNDEDLILSLRSIQYEYVLTEQGYKLRIFATYNDPTEATIRAVYGAAKDKSLNIWCR